MKLTLNLPSDVAEAVAPVFAVLPLEAAMPDLVVRGPAAPEAVRAVEEAVALPAVAARPALVAGLWMLVDELDRSHDYSQGIKDATGSFWHGIMHRREGDFSNSHYWFRQVGSHPAMKGLQDYDPQAFIDEVAAQHRANPAALVAMQRAEWAALFVWCAREA